MDSSDNTEIDQHFDYEQLEGELADSHCEASISEIQGFQCGMVAAGLNQDDSSWQSAIIDLINNGKDFNVSTNALLGEVIRWTFAEMARHDSLAPIFLPDDTYPVIDRLEALVTWSEGFLLGFGLQTNNQTIENKDVKESLTDVAEICRLELEAEDDEESQEALMTLIEHVKVAVQIIHWEMVLKNTANNKNTDLKKPTIH